MIPLGESLFGQTLYRFTRNSGRLLVTDLGGFAFVPLIGKCGQAESESLLDDPVSGP